MDTPGGDPLNLYRMMLKIRRFEEAACQQLLAGKIFVLHTCIGQEAVAVGVTSALMRDDVVTSTHRGHGHCLAKGVEAGEMMAELFGRVSGSNGGRGGSMHIVDPEVGLLGANGIVGGGIPIAVGAALAFQVRNLPFVAVTFFGDGAANEGVCHEAMNLASLWRLPVLFVCENNAYAEMTPQRVHAPMADLWPRAAGYDIMAACVDGNDVLAVKSAAEVAVAHVRGGNGPYFLECKTYRVRGHFEGDPQRYKPDGEAEAWIGNDPLKRLLKYCEEKLEIDRGDLDVIQAEVSAEIEAAVRFADEAAWPDPQTVDCGVVAGEED